jgi:SAM-dependent methyltransferase
MRSGGGTSRIQGELWGARARDWAELNEPAWRPVFEAVIELAGAAPCKRFLDIGCGSGGALSLAARKGAEVTGLDASANLVAIARERLPDALIEIGEMEELPFADQTFDIVTGINSFQFAGDVVNALREAGRVLRREGTFVTLLWGKREECELVWGTAGTVFALLPPERPGAPPSRSLADPAALHSYMYEAGLRPSGAGEISAALTVPDVETAVRVVLSASARAIRHAGEGVVAGAIRSTLPRFTRSDGSVSWNNKFRWATATR